MKHQQCVCFIFSPFPSIKKRRFKQSLGPLLPNSHLPLLFHHLFPLTSLISIWLFCLFGRRVCCWTSQINNARTIKTTLTGRRVLTVESWTLYEGSTQNDHIGVVFSSCPQRALQNWALTQGVIICLILPGNVLSSPWPCWEDKVMHIIHCMPEAIFDVSLCLFFLLTQQQQEIEHSIFFLYYYLNALGDNHSADCCLLSAQSGPIHVCPFSNSKQPDVLWKPTNDSNALFVSFRTWCLGYTVSM